METTEVQQPWYCRDVHPGLIVAVTAAILGIWLAVRFWPVKTAPPVTIFGKAVMPQPSKSELPTKLRPFRPTPPENPKPPVLPAAPAVRSEAPGALDFLPPIAPPAKP